MMHSARKQPLRSAAARDPLPRPARGASRPDAPAGNGATRERIVQAARSVFARDGFDAGTVRDITERAGVNTAAINYHFGSKDGLIRYVMEAGLRPIIEARALALEAAVRQAAGKSPSLRALAAALVEPLAKLSSGAHRETMMMLMHAQTRATDLTNEIVVEQFLPVHERFVDVLQDVLPALSRSEIALRYDCARGAVLQTLVVLAPAAMLVGDGAFATEDEKVKIKRLINFVRAGLGAKPTA